MSSLLQSPKVKVHIGDGFKFLADNTSTYDVIITDSSDPVGPAATLFEKPYFQLLFEALAPGGHISSQGECLWNNLEFIADLHKTAKGIFPVAEYAFTTIPTYPSGQIGFIMAAKAEGRNLRIPLHKVPNCRYYNSEVHNAAFVLPEFGRAILEEGKNVTPLFGRAAAAVAAQNQNAAPKKILLLGSGYVARPCAEYVARNPINQLTIGMFTIFVLVW